MKQVFKSNIFKLVIFRRILLIIFDVAIILISLFTSILLTEENLYFESQSHGILEIFIIIFVFLILYIITGQYKSLTRYMSSFGAYKIILRNSYGIILLASIFYFSNNNLMSLKSVVIFWLLINLLSSIFRFVLRDFLLYQSSFFEKVNKKKVVIYGAGKAGCLLLKTLRYSNNHNVLFFVDDSKILTKRTIDGIPIYSPEALFEKKDNIDIIYFAIPSLERGKKIKILNKLKDLSMEVLIIPSVKQLTSGIIPFEHVRSIKAEDLLGRDSVKPNKKLMEKSLSNKVICITGAGGSIGSEICRQIISYHPKLIVIIDSSEENLYSINKELTYLNSKNNIQIKPILMNICEKEKVQNLFNQFNIDILFHAAAYKHVPIVEANPMSGLSNNILSTINLCDASLKNKIEKMVLISSDKAVRPSNLMGATKRVCELILKSYFIFSNKKNLKTVFSSVRFGNVLGSSGSVVPLFNKQIQKGGPITLTHPKIIRYFMTLEEAAHLVIQSSALAKGGEIFLLDMGDPVSIMSLAKKMVSLSGLRIKDQDCKDGDIEIKMTGLRPGEKLFEELLINEQSEKTENPLIFKDVEKELNYQKIFEDIKILKTLILKGDTKESLNQLKKIVPEWERSKIILEQI